MCVAVATLLACYVPSESPEGGGLLFASAYSPTPHNHTTTSEQRGSCGSNLPISVPKTLDPETVTGATEVRGEQDRAHIDPVGFHSLPDNQDPDPGSGCESGVLVTKGCIRQRLAFVSAAYPTARPTRGSLKQVFNFFNLPTRPE